jgi:hypothetical protein
LRGIVADVPSAWLDETGDARSRYVDILSRRLAARAFVEEAARARTGHL